MNNAEIKKEYEYALELFEDNKEQAAEAAKYTADRLGLSISKVYKAIGW